MANYYLQPYGQTSSKFLQFTQDSSTNKWIIENPGNLINSNGFMVYDFDANLMWGFPSNTPNSVEIGKAYTIAQMTSPWPYNIYTDNRKYSKIEMDLNVVDSMTGNTTATITFYADEQVVPEYPEKLYLHAYYGDTTYEMTKESEGVFTINTPYQINGEFIFNFVTLNVSPFGNTYSKGNVIEETTSPFKQKYNIIENGSELFLINGLQETFVFKIDLGNKTLEITKENNDPVLPDNCSLVDRYTGNSLPMTKTSDGIFTVQTNEESDKHYLLHAYVGVSSTISYLVTTYVIEENSVTGSIDKYENNAQDYIYLSAGKWNITVNFNDLTFQATKETDVPDTPAKNVVIKLGSKTINKIMLGTTQINKIYLGSVIAYNSEDLEV
ncbi:MAG: hypothetical protein NC222_06065 [Staphylococcus sp.]|nr:hypothetical protein [Staphylococcus sp.]